MKTHHAARVAIGLACALGLCASVRAQDPGDEPESSEATPNIDPSAVTDNDTPPLPEREANASLVTTDVDNPPKTDNESVQTLGPFERLPPSAYPEPHVRGIRGGSLWMTFHGLQWPYYPRTGIGVSGYVWVDTGYERVKRGNPSEQGIKYLLQQGRLLLRVTPTYTNGDFFVQGEAEIVANKDQSLHQPDIVDADDVWVRAGMWNRFDIQLGRFEGWEIYHMGMGLDLNTLERQGATDDVFGVPDIYGVTYAFYRPLGVGQVAAHLYPTDFLRFELGTQIGNEFGSNTLAARPVAILDFGWVKLKAGAEYKQLTDQKDGAQGETKRRGAGGALQFVIDPRVEFGVNAAYGLVDKKASDGTVDEKGSITVYSLGGFANARIVGDLLIGIGANITKQHDIHYDAMLGDYGRFSHLQTFVALQYMLLEQLYLKAVFAYAKGEFHPNFGDPMFDNTMLSGRLRLLYLF